MSIETEKWVYDATDGVLRHADTREPVPLYEYRKEAQVLPEALALLDSWQKEHDKTCDCTRCAKTLDILRRAGVLT